MRDIGEWRPGFYSEFRYESNEHSGLAWGAFPGKMTKFQEMHTFWKWACPKFPEIVIFPGKKPRRVRPNIEELFRLTDWRHWGPIIGIILTDWRHWGPIIGILLTDCRHWDPAFPGSRVLKMGWDPVFPGSRVPKMAWDPAFRGPRVPEMAWDPVFPGSRVLKMGWDPVFPGSRVLKMYCFPIFAIPQPFRPHRGPKLISFSIKLMENEPKSIKID